MAKRSKSITDKNIDRLSSFLSREISSSSMLSAEIPNGAHVFHGAYNDNSLTEDNLKMATNIMLGMTLGYVEEAPLVMIFEYQPNRETLIDLSSEACKRSAQVLIRRIQETNQRELSNRLDELVAA
ncbi:MAG: hypothetical protein FJ010_10565 [Chloroflexi bacterium]|nr:hypothetical protein [Chloroflexota bacterium]